MKNNNENENENENKYDKTLEKLKRIPFGILTILAGLALGLVPLILIKYDNTPMALFLFLISLASGGYLVLQGIGVAFFKQNLKVSETVYKGNTHFVPVKTPDYIKRSMWYCFIECALYGCLSIICFINANFNRISPLFYVDYCTQ